LSIIKTLDKYIIRNVEQSDLEKVYKMRKYIVSESDTVLSSEQEITIEGMRSWIESWKDNPKRLFLVVEFKGEIIAQLWVWFLDNKEKLSHVAEFGLEIVKEHRGVGLGIELCKIAVQWACEKGAKRLQAETLEKNMPMRKILENLGFKLEGTMEAYFRYNDRYENVLIYAKLFNV